MEKKISVKTLYLIAVISLGLIGLGLGSTYAMFTASAEISNPISFSSNLSYQSDIIETIDVTIAPGKTITKTMNVTNSTSSSLNYITWYITDSNNIDVGISSVSANPTGVLASSGSATVEVKLKNKGDTSITLTVGVSSSPDSVVLGSNMEQVPNSVVILENLVEYITDLYTNASKTVVTNNNVNYNYASSVSLMNDRLGGTTSDLDAGNIRYYGASPNNYIYFNCDDYSNQSDTTCEKWRIIGVFDGKVKIIRNKSIGDFSWDNKNTSTGAENAYAKNDWTTARLMKLLNPSDYFAVDANDNGLGQSLYYTAQSGTCYSGQNNATKSCDFTSAGLKNDTTRNMIEEVTWNIGGHDSSSVYSDQIYSYERGTTVYTGRPTSWTGKIALMYPSDYGYATDFSKCSQSLGNYSSSTDSYACRTNDWLYNSATQWLLTPHSSSSHGAWRVFSSGGVYSGYSVFSAYGVRPVLYLNSKLVIESGEGTSGLPYRLSVS